MQMYHPEESQSVALTSGHTFVVPKTDGDTGKEVPQRFAQKALAMGCLPVGSKPEAEMPGETRADLIKKAMRLMMESDDETFFDVEGKPAMEVLTKKCGFSVARRERDAIWPVVVAEVDDKG